MPSAKMLVIQEDTEEDDGGKIEETDLLELGFPLQMQRVLLLYCHDEYG